jgi:hypothetical protein
LKPCPCYLLIADAYWFRGAHGRFLKSNKATLTIEASCAKRLLRLSGSLSGVQALAIVFVDRGWADMIKDLT